MNTKQREALQLLRFIWYALNVSSSKYFHKYMHTYEDIILAEYNNISVLQVIISVQFTQISNSTTLAYNKTYHYRKRISQTVYTCTELYNLFNLQKSPDIQDYLLWQKWRTSVKNKEYHISAWITYIWKHCYNEQEWYTVHYKWHYRALQHACINSHSE